MNIAHWVDIREDETPDPGGEQGDAYDFSTPVTDAVSLTAKWTQLHKVSFDMNGHGAVIKPVTVADGGSIAAPAAPAADGLADSRGRGESLAEDHLHAGGGSRARLYL